VAEPEKKNDRALMEMALKLAANSVAEPDGRVHPKVGAVVARDGFVLSTGFRGQTIPGAHAEECALLQLKDDAAVGATVFSTLEPCTERGTTPCSLLLIKRGVTRLVYGMLDPNPDIRGQGEWLLEEHGIEVSKFEVDLVRKIKAQNADFIDYMRGLGLVITSPKEGETIDSPHIPLHGVFRVFPRPGDRIVVFGRRDFTYYPQEPIQWNREDRTWTCPRIWLTAGEKPVEYGIVVARVSEDLAVWLRSYTHVKKLTEKWIGAEMPTLPPGFEVLASVNVTRAAKK
jgi:pyrimidine deaminase RibD-like protein